MIYLTERMYLDIVVWDLVQQGWSEKDAWEEARKRLSDVRGALPSREPSVRR